MRTHNLYQLYDRTAQTVHGGIVADKNDASAIRSFHGILAAKDTLPGTYPESFELVCIGIQNEETGEIAPNTPPQIVASGKEWKERKDAEAANERVLNFTGRQQ